MRSNARSFCVLVARVPVLQVVQVVHVGVERAVAVEPLLGVVQLVEQRADVALDDAAPARTRRRASR